MLYLFTFLTLLLSFLRSNVVYAHNDELMEAMVKAAREQGLVAGLPAPPKNKPGPKPGPPSANLRALQGKDKPKPDPKPKPTPPQYMVFTNHIDDNTCGDRSGIESHGYLIGTCYTGKGDLAGLHWSFTPTVDTTNIHLNYAFYADADCTVSVFSSVESVPNGCQARGTAGGHLRAKNFQILPAIPNYKGGSLFNGYVSEAVCKRDNRPDVLLWSFLKNNACDPQISSPVYGEHVTDETRTCKKDKIVATLYDSNDLTCSGAVTTTTNIGPSWECVDATISGVDATFVNPKCV